MTFLYVMRKNHFTVARDNQGKLANLKLRILLFDTFPAFEYDTLALDIRNTKITVSRWLAIMYLDTCDDATWLAPHS